MVVRELDLDLDAFEGPFDLLLTLVLKEELEPAEVDVAGIVLAFVERLAERAARPWPAAASAGPGPAPPPPDAADGTMPSGVVPSTAPSGLAPSATPQERAELDLDACGEFLVLVASLLELKARGLLADEDAELSELEPEEAAEELARRLAEYRRMKGAAAWLAERLEGERDRFFRLGPAPSYGAWNHVRRLDPQDPAGLATALRALAAEPPSVSVAHMALRFPPVGRFLERFRAVLRRRTGFDLDGELAGLSRAEQAVGFLAVLELRKAGEIELAQAAPFQPIRVSRAREESTATEEKRAAWTVRSA